MSSNILIRANISAMLSFCIDFEKAMLRQGRSWFGRRGTRRSQTARAWPRAAQHKSIAFFNRANIRVIIIFSSKIIVLFMQFSQRIIPTGTCLTMASWVCQMPSETLKFGGF